MGHMISLAMSLLAIQSAFCCEIKQGDEWDLIECLVCDTHQRVVREIRSLIWTKYLSGEG